MSSGGGHDDAASGLALARGISTAPDFESALRRLTTAAVVHLPAADAAGVTVAAKDGYATVAATDDLPDSVDALQYHYGGPCVATLDAATTQLCVEDLHTDRRWPQFASAAAAQTPVRSMLSCRLSVTPEQVLGSLNIYARTPHAFDSAAADTARLLAGHGALAAALVRERERAAHLQQALLSNRTIGAAIGILMARYLVSEAEAFDLLRKVSQHSNRKVRDIALEVLSTGALDAAKGRAHGARAR